MLVIRSLRRQYEPDDDSEKDSPMLNDEYKGELRPGALQAPSTLFEFPRIPRLAKQEAPKPPLRASLAAVNGNEKARPGLGGW